MTGSVDVRLYGRLAAAAGSRLAMADAAGCTVGELRKRIALQHPAIAHDIAVERSRAFGDERWLQDGDRISAQIVEFLPPVSGG